MITIIDRAHTYEYRGRHVETHVDAALRRLTHPEGASPSELRTDLDTVVEHLRSTDACVRGTGVLSRFDGLHENVKVLIIQQFFQHSQAGSHKTAYEREMVATLLSEWFDIRIQESPSDEAEASTTMEALPGRRGASAAALRFGGTDICLMMSEGTHRAARELVRTVAEEAVLTTDATSPPCELAEFVPLWLKDRQRALNDLYIAGTDTLGPDHPIDHYFTVQQTALASAGVRVLESSTEMGIVANGDGLRYHRDRLVNQYAYLEGSTEPPGTYEVVQYLTLIDWDMQPQCVSGTVLDHPNGDRYLFTLGPGEVVGLFFSEPAHFPGPMMMPYHCALPVIDAGAARTAGVAKGKRLSALVRGIAKADQVRALKEGAQRVTVNEVLEERDGTRRYTNGVHAWAAPALPETATVPVALPDCGAEGVTAIELDAGANHELVRRVLDCDSGHARVFRVEKHGAGFSDLGGLLRDLAGAGGDVALVNRTLRSPQGGACYPLAFDATEQGLPWIQLCRADVGTVWKVPAAERGSLRLPPINEILHRPAVLDSFHPLSSARPRMTLVVDVFVSLREAVTEPQRSVSTTPGPLDGPDGTG